MTQQPTIPKNPPRIVWTPDLTLYIRALSGLEREGLPEVRKSVTDQVIAECEALGIEVFGYSFTEPFAKLVGHKAVTAAREVWAKYPQSDIPRLKALGFEALRAWDYARTSESNVARETATVAERERLVNMIKAAGYNPETED